MAASRARTLEYEEEAPQELVKDVAQAAAAGG
jgi:hypothetical protein